MKTQREVFNKLFKEEKTELSAQKIELALIDDLKKEYGKLQTLGIEADILSLADELSSRLPKYQSLKSKLDDAMKKAKELGANDIFSKLKSLNDGCDSSIKTIKKQVGSIKSAI